MKQKILIESLSMDLLRVAMGLHRGSFTMANRFKEEALKRTQELRAGEVDERLKKLLDKTELSLNSNEERTAEDALMYSTLFKNFAQTHF